MRICNELPKTTAEQALSGSQKRIRRARIQDEQHAQGSSGPAKALLLFIGCASIRWLNACTGIVQLQHIVFWQSIYLADGLNFALLQKSCLSTSRFD